MVGTLVNGSRPIQSPHSRHRRTRSVVASQRKPLNTKSWIKLGDQIDKDPDFLFARTIIGSMIQSSEIAIEVDGKAGVADNPQLKFLVDHLTDLWYETLPNLLDGFKYGFAAYEQVFTYDQMNRLNIVELDPLPAELVERKDSKETGEFEGIKVKGGDGAELKPTYCWWFGLNATPLHPHGFSIYDGAPVEVWKESHEHDENWKVWAKKFALGRQIAYAPESYPETGRPAKEGDKGQTNQDGTPANPIDDTADALRETESGGTTVLPSSTDHNGKELFRVDPMESAPNTQGMETRSQTLSDRKLKSMRIPPRAVTQDAAVGSYSMSQTHLEVLFSTIYGYLDQIVASFQKYVIDRIVALNWPVFKRPKLTLTYAKIDPKLTGLVIEIVKSILLAGQPSPFIAEGVVDFSKLLDIAGIPTGDNIQQRLEKVKESLSQQSQQGQGASPFPSAQRLFGKPKKRKLAAPPASATYDWESAAARADREMAPLLREVQQILESGVQFDADGRVIGLDPTVRGRL